MTISVLSASLDHFSPAELSAARLDGDISELAEGYIPADAVETPALRAQSLAPLVHPHSAVTGIGAAWVHGAPIDPPVRVTLQRAVPWRIHEPLSARIIYSDMPLKSSEIIILATVRVTTRVRTIIDLARQNDDRAQAVLDMLVTASPEIIPATLSALEDCGRVHGKPLAREKLREYMRGYDEKR